MVKIIAIALTCAILVVYLKSINSEYYNIALVGSGVILLSFAFEYISSSMTFFNNLINLTGVDKSFYQIIFKITAIGYLVEFGASTIQDFGLVGLADKLVFFGKIVIFSMSLPILNAVFNLIVGLLQ